MKLLPWLFKGLSPALYVRMYIDNVFNQVTAWGIAKLNNWKPLELKWQTDSGSGSIAHNYIVTYTINHTKTSFRNTTWEPTFWNYHQPQQNAERAWTPRIQLPDRWSENSRDGEKFFFTYDPQRHRNKLWLITVVIFTTLYWIYREETRADNLKETT